MRLTATGVATYQAPYAAAPSSARKQTTKRVFRK
jgi:hypothetical protein